MRVVVAEPGTEVTRRGGTLRRAGLILIALAGWALVSIAHGSVPGFVRDAPSHFLFAGLVNCMGDSPLSSGFICPDVGLDLGAPVMGGLPFVLLASLIGSPLALPPDVSMLFASVLLDLVGMVGAWLLLSSLGVQRWIALPSAVMYQISIGVLATAAYVGTFWGFVLMPAYVLAYQVGSASVLGGGPLVKRLGGVALLVGASLTAVFMDGYSFVVSAAVFLILRSAQMLSDRSQLKAGMGQLAVFLAAQGAAVVAYGAYIPGGASFAATPVDFFRAMGADLSTLFSPTAFTWAAAHFSLDADHSALWGDGGNAQFNYLGVVAVLLALASLFVRSTRRQASALAALALITLALAIGPSVKIDEERPPIEGEITYEDYLMPAGVASVDLPWGSLFTAVPGVSDMRATYRWLVGTQLAIIGMAGLTVTAVWESKQPSRRVAAAVLGSLAVIDLAPNLPLFLDNYQQRAEVVGRVREQVGEPLRAAMPPADTVLYVPSGNDFLATYLTPYADIRSYNVGGDKNNALSRATWPEPVTAAAASPTPDTIAGALSSSADAVVITFFSLRWNSYSFPPTTEQEAPGRSIVDQLIGDARFDVDTTEFFAIVRLADR